MNPEINIQIKYLQTVKAITLRDAQQKRIAATRSMRKTDREETSFSYSTLAKIAAILDVKVEDLIGSDPAPFLRNQMMAINGNVYSGVLEERKLYEEHIALLKEKIKMLEKEIESLKGYKQ